MRWLINYIRSCFCKHEWELIFNSQTYGTKITGERTDAPICYTKIYRCKKCGIQRKYTDD